MRPSLFPPTGRIFISDGAWGTELQKRGLPLGQPPDLWNLSHPEQVAEVARSYVAAGSQIMLTNTFRANPIALAAVAAADKAPEINRRGAAISRAAAGKLIYVFGSIGPTGKNLAAEEINGETAAGAFRIQAESLAEGGVDALLLETFNDIDEATVALRAAKSTGLPVLVSFTFDLKKKTECSRMDFTPETAARTMTDEGADAVGANCGNGPASCVQICRRLRSACQLPIWIKPNAGIPSFRKGRPFYKMSPHEFARFLPIFVQAGASFVGGCCGAGPQFIQVLRTGVMSVNSN